MSYHEPVLLNECIEGLITDPNGVYVDATFGGGGHSRKILEKLGPEGQLHGFDQDEDALVNLPEDERLVFHHHNFSFLQQFLRLHRVSEIDGLLADLGVSSHQFDTPERGFSYRFEAELDMRMNQQADLRADTVLNTYEPDALQLMFSQYGEVRNARTLAARIVEAREHRPFRTVQDLIAVAEAVRRGQRNRYLAQVFQALRIEVNDELGVLERLLEQAFEMLKEGGRLVVISYHSLEDRAVKNFLRTGSVTGEVKKDFYGRIYRPFEILTRKAVVPDASEIERNPRAHSARLRIGAKLLVDWPEDQ
jgi:16S rRNA (cytosine1402-N4)-methyltransferase